MIFFRNLKMTRNSVYVCELCKNYYDDPIHLPCHCTICKFHLKEFILVDHNLVKCPIELCQKLFEYPINGYFAENIKMKNAILMEPCFLMESLLMLL